MSIISWSTICIVLDNGPGELKSNDKLVFECIVHDCENGSWKSLLCSKHDTLLSKAICGWPSSLFALPPPTGTRNNWRNMFSRYAWNTTNPLFIHPILRRILPNMLCYYWHGYEPMKTNLLLGHSTTQSVEWCIPFQDKISRNVLV